MLKIIVIFLVVIILVCLSIYFFSFEEKTKKRLYVGKLIVINDEEWLITNYNLAKGEVKIKKDNTLFIITLEHFNNLKKFYELRETDEQTN